MSTADSECIHEKCVIETKERQIVTDQTYDRSGYHPNKRVDRNGHFRDRNWQFEDRTVRTMKAINYSPIYSLYTLLQKENSFKLLGHRTRTFQFIAHGLKMIAKSKRIRHKSHNHTIHTGLEFATR